MISSSSTTSSLSVHLPMSITVSGFDTRQNHAPSNPQPDTHTTIRFPQPYVAPPRILHGLCLVDASKEQNIRIDSRVTNITKESATFHVTSWHESKLHQAVIRFLSICPTDLRYLSGQHTRDLNAPPATHIHFQRPFLTPPKVVVFFNHINLDKDHDWNVFTTATDIDVDGFTLNIDTRGDTVLYRARVAWFAYPEDREHVYSTSINMRQIHQVGYPQFLHEIKPISFSETKFNGTPEVFVALNAFEISCKENFCIKAYVDNVTKDGLTWHIETWSNAILSSAGATIIAVK
ncbi:hypothetical protein NP233_g151 [Leucocoprinus birnbaumii]|uniref:H-type lectin domain-containing protein n=1 Tax=Leucocoprinus birnbaumii TaxID=56174 RepID=A0AAD5YW17_9AGAR|nr:hypothetical protein NP233_g151 [Leucocoprinus birnbaumii]